MPIVRNPILPGFHPDPSACRVGEWYYLATSTFEWWPGVRLHRSRDLATWELIGGALDRTSQLSLQGNPDSGGVWAPALSHADGLFWLVYSDMKSFHGPVKDVRNFLVTAERIEGPWSDPVPLNSSGFDPSLFHDEDGRKWFLNQAWLPRADATRFAGVFIQEYDPGARRLVGPRANIFAGTSLGVTEGPHLLRREGYYWLIVAEGGTGANHAVTVARSRELLGPYEVHPDNPLLTSHGAPAGSLQKAGHGSLVEMPNGRWALFHLCSRPQGEPARSILGRETALQLVSWPAGGWPRLAQGGRHPADAVVLPGALDFAAPYLDDFADDFSARALHPHWNTLREPTAPDWCTLAERPGWLRLRGRHSLQSTFAQSLVACRALHHAFSARVRIEFSPTDPRERAGLALYYDTRNHLQLYVAGDGRGGRELRVLVCDNRQAREVLSPGLPLPPEGEIELAVELRELRASFRYAVGGGKFQPAGPELSAANLGDEHPVEGGIGWAFTGAFVALCAQDSNDEGRVADFTGFRYRALA